MVPAPIVQDHKLPLTDSSTCGKLRVMKAIAVAIMAFGLAALVDRQVNDSRYTDAMLRMATEIKRGFVGR